MAESQAKRFVKHTGTYAIGNIARQLTGFIMLPIYTRYLTPADYGVVGLLMFSLSLVEIVFGARLAHAIPKFYHAESDELTRSEVVSTAWIITTLVSMATSIVLMLSSEGISQFLFDSSAFTLAVTLFSINLVTMGMENYGLTYLRVREMPVIFVLIGIAKLILQVTLNVILVVIHEMGVLGVVLSSVIASSVFAVGLSLYLLSETHLRFSITRTRELISFSWPLWVAGFAALYIGSSNRYYLGQFVSLEDVGFFELASKFSQILMVLVWMPIMQYWEVERFKYYVPHKTVSGIYRTMHKVVFVFLSLAAVGISLFSKPVILLMADPAFHQAFRAVIWLVFSGVINCMTMYVNFSFHATSRTTIIRNNNYMTAGVVTVFYLGLIPVLGFVGAAMSLTFARLVQFFFAYRASKLIYDMNLDLGTTSILILAGFFIALACDHVTIDGFLLETGFRILVFILFMSLLWFFIRRDKELFELASRVLSRLPIINRTMT